MQETLSDHLLVCHTHTCFDKNMVWVLYDMFASDFTSDVWIIVLPGALDSQSSQFLKFSSI